MLWGRWVHLIPHEQLFAQFESLSLTGKWCVKCSTTGEEKLPKMKLQEEAGIRNKQIVEHQHNGKTAFAWEKDFCFWCSTPQQGQLKEEHKTKYLLSTMRIFSRMRFNYMLEPYAFPDLCILSAGESTARLLPATGLANANLPEHKPPLIIPVPHSTGSLFLYSSTQSSLCPMHCAGVMTLT